MRTLVVSSRNSGRSFAAILFAILIVAGSCRPAFGQELTSATAQRPPLITAAIDDSQLTTLRGNTHPLARPQFDLGTASPCSFTVNGPITFSATFVFDLSRHRSGDGSVSAPAPAGRL